MGVPAASSQGKWVGWAEPGNGRESGAGMRFSLRPSSLSPVAWAGVEVGTGWSQKPLSSGCIIIAS